MPNGKYIVADDVWVKRIDARNFDIIINETKLHEGVVLTTNQQMFKGYVDSGVRQFTLRSVKFERDTSLQDLGFVKNSNLNLKGILKTVGEESEEYTVLNF